jgi:hypothetical protein
MHTAHVERVERQTIQYLEKYLGHIPNLIIQRDQIKTSFFMNMYESHLLSLYHVLLFSPFSRDNLLRLTRPARAWGQEQWVRERNVSPLPHLKKELTSGTLHANISTAVSMDLAHPSSQHQHCLQRLNSTRVASK